MTIAISWITMIIFEYEIQPALEEMIILATAESLSAHSSFSAILTSLLVLRSRRRKNKLTTAPMQAITAASVLRSAAKTCAYALVTSASH